MPIFKAKYIKLIKNGFQIKNNEKNNSHINNITSNFKAQNPNYSEHVAPIIYDKCLKCHHNGGISPIPLETYSNTVLNAGMIQHVTSTGEMPPWPPDTLISNILIKIH